MLYNLTLVLRSLFSFFSKFGLKLGCVHVLYKSVYYTQVNMVLYCNYYVWVNDQARGQDGLILAKLFFYVFVDQHEVEVHKLAKKERGLYSASITEQAWSIKDLLIYGI